MPVVRLAGAAAGAAVEVEPGVLLLAMPGSEVPERPHEGEGAMEEGGVGRVKAGFASTSAAGQPTARLRAWASCYFGGVGKAGICLAKKSAAGVAVVVILVAALWLAGCGGGVEVGSDERSLPVVWPLWPPGFAGSAECPREEVSRSWHLGGNRWLLEQQSGYDVTYWVWDSSSGALEVAVPFVETARFDRLSPGGPVFVARGGGDTGAYDFPYELVYDPGARSLTRRPLYLPWDRRVEFGKDSWPQVLAKVGFDENGVSFDFRPREGAVLAGGHWLPLVASSYDREARELELVFRQVEMSAGIAGVLRPDCAGCPVDRVTIRYGEGNLEAGIALRWPALWRAEVLSLGGEGYSSTVRCRVLVRQAR